MSRKLDLSHKYTYNIFTALPIVDHSHIPALYNRNTMEIRIPALYNRNTMEIRVSMDMRVRDS